jgi:hypothetical protein
MRDLRERLSISTQKLEEINKFLVSEQNTILDPLVDIVEKNGGVKEINRKAHESRRIENLLDRLESTDSPFLKDLTWLQEQRDENNFVSLDEYRKEILGERTGSVEFDEALAVTLEIRGKIRNRQRGPDAFQVYPCEVYERAVHGWGHNRFHSGH